MKVECEVEWASEEGIDEAIKHAVIRELARRIECKLYAKIEEEASNGLARMIDDLLMKLTDKFMNREIIVTDRWGDVQEKHENVEELLKSKFDGFLGERVNKKGEAVKSCDYGGYRDLPTRVEYFIDRRIDCRRENIIKELTNMVDAKIDEKKKELTAEMVKNIAKKLGAFEK